MIRLVGDPDKIEQRPAKLEHAFDGLKPYLFLFW
jgi:hypothetical protein